MGTSFSFPLSSPLIGGSSYSFVPLLDRAMQLGVIVGDIPGAGDRLIDPATLDYVRLSNGEWAETDDSRTIVFIALSVRLGGSPYDPTHGTAIAERRAAGEPIDPEFLQAETYRVGQALANEGVLTGMTIAVRDAAGAALRDESGALLVKCEWIDLASGNPVSMAFSVR